jgi:hypothetical protein
VDKENTYVLYMNRVSHAWRTRQWSRCSYSSSYSPGSGTSSAPVQKWERNVQGQLVQNISAELGRRMRYKLIAH